MKDSYLRLRPARCFLRSEGHTYLCYATLLCGGEGHTYLCCATTLFFYAYTYLGYATLLRVKGHRFTSYTLLPACECIHLRHYGLLQGSSSTLVFSAVRVHTLTRTSNHLAQTLFASYHSNQRRNYNMSVSTSCVLLLMAAVAAAALNGGHVAQRS